MSFKDLGKSVPPRPDSAEDAEVRARAAARHRAKEERASRAEEHRAEGEHRLGGAAKREPDE